MSDDEPPEPVENLPPAGRAPLSVWLAAGLLFAPGLGLVGAGLASGVSEAWGFGVVGLVFGSLPATLLVCEDLGGSGCGVFGGIGCGLAAAGLALFLLALVLVTGRFNTAGLLTLAVVAAWGSLVAGLIWWPATRRWCGMLPPAPDADDA